MIVLQLIIQMQQAYLRSLKQKYNEDTYNEWGQLPPNILLPNTPTIAALALTFTKLIYLNQIRADGLELKLQWWGMKKSHCLAYNEVSICQGKYVVCSSIDRLLSYFNDMKLLGIQICDKNRTIGKSYLNFLILKGWRGQQYEGVLDIKQGNKKIGQISFTMQISTVDNPYLPKQTKIRPDQKSKKDIQVKFSQPSAQEITKRSLFNEYDGTDKEINYFEEESNKKQPTNKRITSRSIVKSQNNQQFPLEKPLYYQHKNKIDRFIYDQPVLRTNNEAKYEAQLFRLVEDYNLLFQKATTIISSRHNIENNIEIQIIKIQSKVRQPTQVEVSIPLIDGNINCYRLAVGGLVKLQFASSSTENQLINYLKQCVVTFRLTQKIQGSIKLSKILSHCNQILQIKLTEREGKRETKRQVGACWIKAIPPLAKPEPPISEPIKLQKQEKVQFPRELVEQRKQEYVLLNLKAYNSIQNYNRPSNSFIRVLCNEDTVGQTNTLWNKSASFVFNEKLTCKIWLNKLRFELCDRQKSIIKLAVGQLTMSSPLGINIELPLKAKMMGADAIAGYISLDYFKNGLQSITKMVTILNHKQKINNQEKQTEDIVTKKQNIIDQLQINNQIQEKIDDCIENNKENQMQINHIEQQVKQKPLEQKKTTIYEPRLTIIEIYNKIFTDLYSHASIISKLSEKNEHKVTEFLQIFNQLVSRSIITNTNLNELITHLLFKTSMNINKVNTLSLKESYEAFRTYYEEIIQEKDDCLATFMTILQGMGITVNDLEYDLRNSKNMWEKINQLLSYHKGQYINIVEDLRTFLQKPYPEQVSCGQFCDILRRYEVYQTTLGSQLNASLLCARIYRNVVELLEELQPNISLYSYNQLIELLEAEQIILTHWELINLKQYLSKFSNKKTVPKYPNYQQEIQNSSGRFKEVQHREQGLKHNGAQSNRPTISKSPTFGYLHQPQHMKPQLLTSENYMVDSLALKMQNLAISPINYNSNQTNYNQAKVSFTNLKYRLFDLYINDIRINFQSFHSSTANNYKSNSLMQQPYSKEIGSSIEVRRNEESDISENVQEEHRGQSLKSGSYEANNNIQLALEHIEKAFSYRVQIHFEQLDEGIYLQCPHNQWSAIVSEQGEYLGGILFS